jgi:UPF0176 protein
MCENIGLHGRILVAKEGINGSVSGKKEQIEEYKRKFREDKRFEDLWFKEDIGKEHPFRKMQVKVRDTIVNMGADVDMKNTGYHISPDEFLGLYDKSGNLKKDVVLVDARNDYEYKVGRFKGAIDFGIKTFRQFPNKSLEKLRGKEKKKIIMFCTGGIRCEKASAFLKENGFEDVSQLNGGIINFAKEKPDTMWEGSLFVFDKRLVTLLNEKDKNPITKCETCEKDSDLYRNCRNVNCDRLVIQCIPCQEYMTGCCSQNCLSKFREQCHEKALRNQNRRINAISA